MNYSFTEIADITKAQILTSGSTSPIKNVIYDTRKASFPESSIFFAFKGKLNDGHNYVKHAYDLGVRHFVISKKIDIEDMPEANVMKVNSTLMALQKLAVHHRLTFKIPIIAITGSNGKTIVKEWLGKALSTRYNVCKSPKSYNSQIGVALSLLNLDVHHDIAIIEAGISKPNEMRFLSQMIHADIGIFTNIGDAHNAGFISKSQKVKEKLRLFKDAQHLIYCSDAEDIRKELDGDTTAQLLDWSLSKEAFVQVQKIQTDNNRSQLTCRYKGKDFTITTSFKSREYIENMMHVVCCLLHFSFKPEEIQTIIDQLDPLENRLELRAGINDNILINDSYSLDMAALQLALEFQDLHAGDHEKILIASAFDSDETRPNTYEKMALLLESKQIRKTYLIGIEDSKKPLFKALDVAFFESVEDFLKKTIYQDISDSCILIKGARKFKLENIFQRLSKQNHQTVLESNFAALDHNIGVYRSYLEESTKIMAVIKAEAYGSGVHQMAKYLEQKKLDYLAVAIIDEGIEIRSSGVELPIMVFNVQESQIEDLWQHRLEPEVYAPSLLKQLIEAGEKFNTPLNIHIKVDTGMNRLGFSEDNIDQLISELKNQSHLKVRSAFSHLAASENTAHDAFTKQQCELFETLADRIESELGYRFNKHILNTAGIIRHKQYQFDMVRIGLGLYGIDETHHISQELQTVHSLKARILQIKELKPGESVGYGRAAVVDKETRMAIISIGYADGLMRMCGNGRFHMMLNGVLVPTLGNICMDVTMLDITEVEDARPGDEVLVFGPQHSIEHLAKACQTISYEIISRIAPRVKRIYTHN